MSMKKLKNYEKINFADFPFVKTKRPYLAAPGIFAIFCNVNKRAYFESSPNILEEMEFEQDDILNDLFEGPKDLISDFKKYEWDSFYFIIIAVGKEWKPIPKCLKEIENVKKSWPYSLY